MNKITPLSQNTTKTGSLLQSEPVLSGKRPFPPIPPPNLKTKHSPISPTAVFPNHIPIKKSADYAD